MRGLFGTGLAVSKWAGLACVGLLAACGGASADVTGTAGGVDFDKTKYVFFGGPFVIISMLEIDCEDLDYVKRNYEIGQAPTDSETKLLQFSYDPDALVEGSFPVAIDAAISASVVSVAGGAFYESIATGGLFTVESISEEDSASGVFEGLQFDDGALDGSFDAVWCRNLKAR
ncbi:MAG: hypothetical protein V4850_27290 [Myxococcota bacterium]